MLANLAGIRIIKTGGSIVSRENKESPLRNQEFRCSYIRSFSAEMYTSQRYTSFDNSALDFTILELLRHFFKSHPLNPVV